MTAFAYYLLKVLICSGVLYLYYFVALRNKVFHQWNRFYLLAAVVLSLVIPLVQVTVYNYLNDDTGTTLQLLQVVQDADNYMETITISNKAPASDYFWIVLGYGAVSLLIAALMIRSLLHIFRIVRSHSVKLIDNIRFVNTNIEGTPFSFFRFIFWNRDIDLQSSTGQQIFQHELVHVKEKHSFDKIFLQVVLMVFWCNPFFWLIRRELKNIHEFIADQKSVGERGPAAFAAMVLQTAYPAQFNSLTNQFFQTSIKRRLAMLTKIQNPRISYISRIAALVVIVATVFAFTIRTREVHKPLPINKEVVVVIDAGHGRMPDGKYNGARVGDVVEDEIVLSLAKKIEALNGNKNIRIVLTRNSEEIIDLKKRVQIANEHKADLFISLHANAETGEANDSKSGVEILIAPANHPLRTESELLGSAIAGQLSSLMPIQKSLQSGQNMVYVLNASQCPAVLIECGNISVKKDRDFMQNEQNQKEIALKILRAIELYVTAERKPASSSSSFTDTVPKKKTATERDNKEPVFKKVDVEASVNNTEWKKFLENNLQSVIEHAASEGMKPGQYTVFVRFIVDRDGDLYDFSVTKDPGFELGKKVLEIMKNSPRWKPGLVKGKPVRSYHTQPITFVISEDGDDASPPKDNTPQLSKTEAAKMTSLNLNGKEIVSFQITSVYNNVLKTNHNVSGKFNQVTQDMMKSLVPDDIVTFENIVVRENGKEIKHPSLLFKVTQ